MDKTKILVAMNHELTPEQLQELDRVYGNPKIFYLKDVNHPLFRQLEQCPSDEGNLRNLADHLAEEMKEFDYTILPIGTPAFNFLLPLYLAWNDALFGADLRLMRFKVLFAFSTRNVVEKRNDDGTIEKKVIFKHEKFIQL